MAGERRWPARESAPDGDTIVFVGDGSYLMLNSDLYSSVLSGHKMIVVLCDNGGYAVIDRLQVSQGGEPFNNLLARRAGARRQGRGRLRRPRHSAGLRRRARSPPSTSSREAFDWARTTDRTTVIVIETDPHEWTEGGAWWEVGVPETSERPSIQQARDALDAAKQRQRRGV